MKNYEIKVEGATLTIRPRTYSYRRPSEYNSEPRMYVSIADETILENLENRKRRPYNVFKTLIHSSDIASALNIGRLQWSQKAGCAMCPCSPGFILNKQQITIDGETIYNFDVWVKLDSAPSVDETKPARVLAGL